MLAWLRSNHLDGRSIVSRMELFITCSVCVVTYSVASAFDAMERAMTFTEAHEGWQLDELFSIVLVLGIAFAVFATRRWRELQIEMTARIDADARTRASEQRFATAFAASPYATLITELTTERIVDANVAFQTLSGYEKCAIIGRSIGELHLWNRPERVAAAARQLMEDGAVRDVETELRTSEGRTRNVLFSAVVVDVDGRTCVLSSIADISERKSLEMQLTHQAFHDSLTGLANRALFRDRAALALARRERHPNTLVAVLFLDLDDFKRINDGLGHAAGDALLKSVASRLVSATRQTDTVARLGGDEFAVLLDITDGQQEATSVAERVVSSFRRPIDVTGRDVHVAMSVGLAVAAPNDDVELLLRNADVAMYEAKARGKARLVTFEPSMGNERVDRLELEAGLQAAIDGNELRLVYQPIVRLDSGAPDSIEALVRWQHPTRGLVPPNAFIPIAEETGLIISLGRWVLMEACRAAQEWRTTLEPGCPGMAPLPVSVNVSGKQLLSTSLLRDVKEALDASGLPASSLILEITETVLMTDTERALTAMRALKALGVSLAVDDFGTGYSSLSYLRQFPVDVLKIDRSFIQGVAGSGKEAALTRTIVALGEMLQLKTVAEGVENTAQRSHLRELGCAMGQGYLFARPVSETELTTYLRAAPTPEGDPAPSNTRAVA